MPEGATQLVVDIVRDDPTAVTVRARGEVDMTNASSLADQLSAASNFTGQPVPVIVELSGITFLGTSGLSVLVKLNEECTAAGVSLRIVPSRAVRRAVEVTGLDGVLRLYPTVSDALA